MVTPFTVLPRQAARLTPYAFQQLNELIHLAGWPNGGTVCAPSLSQLCRALGVSKPRVTKSNKELENAGLVTIHRPRGWRGALIANCYELRLGHCLVTRETPSGDPCKRDLHNTQSLNQKQKSSDAPAGATPATNPDTEEPGGPSPSGSPDASAPASSVEPTAANTSPRTRRRRGCDPATRGQMWKALEETLEPNRTRPDTPGDARPWAYRALGWLERYGMTANVDELLWQIPKFCAAAEKQHRPVHFRGSATRSKRWNGVYTPPSPEALARRRAAEAAEAEAQADAFESQWAVILDAYAQEQEPQGWPDPISPDRPIYVGWRLMVNVGQLHDLMRRLRPAVGNVTGEFDLVGWLRALDARRDAPHGYCDQWLVEQALAELKQLAAERCASWTATFPGVGGAQ